MDEEERVADVSPPLAKVATRETLVTEGGLSASLEGEPGAQALRVRDPAGQIVIEVLEREGRVTLRVVEGDLELAAERGRLRLSGAEGVEIDGPSVTIRTDHLRQVVGVLETHARRILEKSKDTYREAEGVSQTKAGQLRLVAKKTFRALAKQVRMRAERDVKVLAEKIYLG